MNKEELLMQEAAKAYAWSVGEEVVEPKIEENKDGQQILNETVADASIPEYNKADVNKMVAKLFEELRQFTNKFNYTKNAIKFSEEVIDDLEKKIIF
jgi:hypothetical protein